MNSNFRIPTELDFVVIIVDAQSMSAILHHMETFRNALLQQIQQKLIVVLLVGQIAIEALKSKRLGPD